MGATDTYKKASRRHAAEASECSVGRVSRRTRELGSGVPAAGGAYRSLVRQPDPIPFRSMLSETSSSAGVFPREPSSDGNAVRGEHRRLLARNAAVFRGLDQTTPARTRHVPFSSPPQSSAGTTAPGSEGRDSPFHVKHRRNARTPSSLSQRFEGNETGACMTMP